MSITCDRSPQVLHRESVDRLKGYSHSGSTSTGSTKYSIAMMDLGALRKEYTQDGLQRASLKPNPFEQFELWFQ